MSSQLHKTLLASVADKATRLREVRKDLLRQKPGTTQRWLQGPQGCDVFLWYEDARGLSQVQLTFEGRVVEWSPSDGVRTGKLMSFNPLEPLVDRARLVFDAHGDAETLELARVLLEHANLDDVTRAMVRKALGVR